MNDAIKKRLKRTAVLSILALCAGAAIAYLQVQHERSNPAQNSPHAMAGLKIGGPFTLMDHTGKMVTDTDFASDYKLIYFGFTYCPAICPTELGKMTQALNAMGTQADLIRPLFITIDPERDTVDTMRSYVSLFHPRLTGLTGTPEQIESVLKSYRVYARKVDPQPAEGDAAALGDYTMDHSSFLYFIDPRGELLAMYRTQDTAAFMAEDMAKRMKTP